MHPCNVTRFPKTKLYFLFSYSMHFFHYWCLILTKRGHILSNIDFMFCHEQDVKYPEYLELQPFMSQAQGEPQIYGLYAVLVHSGFSCHAGHYFCYIKVILKTTILIYQNAAFASCTHTHLSLVSRSVRKGFIKSFPADWLH